MKKLLLFLILLISFCAYTQTFTELNTANLIDTFHGDLKWGDYDNDGDLDLLVTGKKSRTASGDPITKIYTNNGGTFTELATANIENIELGDAEWGDYDNDGDLDLVVIGATNGFTPVTKIYTNTNGTFSELTTANLTSVYSGSVDWGDYDNDGDLDILLTGGFIGGSISKIYTNTNGVFSELTTANLTEVSSSDAVWGDYDNDGDLDILLTGNTGSSSVSKIYTNNNNGTFTELTSANLTGVSYSSVAWGDYDNDGDLDILLTGTAGTIRISKIYTNTAGSFTELPGTNFLGVEEGSVAWGDCDNDGDLDVLITGSIKTAIHINTAGIFTELATPDFPQLWGSSAVWGDYDNDGDLDIAMAGNTRTSFTSKIFTNNSAVSNTIPTAPTNPTAVVNGDEVTLSWTASTDVETPTSGLSYNVFIKENPVGSPIYTKTPMAQEGNGWRKLPNIGNTQQNTSYIYKLPAACSANYTFKVQAIDHAFAGSAFSTEGSFSIAEVINPTIITQDITVQLDTAGNATITPAQIDNGSSDNCGIQSMSLDITDFTTSDIGANTVTLTITDVNGNSDSKTAIVTVESIFTELNTASLSGISKGSVDWGDYDNDGDLDLLLTGKTGSTRISKIYTNTAGTFAELATANLTGVNESASAWGDYDNDGDLDILLSGWDGSAQISKIYRNDTGAFTELTLANLTGVSNSSVAWGDYDNDGDLDVLLAGNTGSTIISKIYTNTSGVFTELVTANLIGAVDGSVDWVDYDNDGDLDIALTGYTGSARISKIYTNTAGVFTELTTANLPQVSFSSTAWGDYDNDGDLDVLVTGIEGSISISKIYTNTAGVFTELNTANLTAVNVGSAVWGDYDNDGDLDVLLTGFTPSGNISKVYTNTAGTFTELLTANLTPVAFSTAAWGDYDNDGDLDIVLAGEFPRISKIYTNTNITPNTGPTPPTNPTAIVNGDEVALSWTASTDAETPSSGLSYNVYIKDASASSAYNVSPMAQENDGWRKLPAIGNAQQNTSYVYKVANACINDYTFKVQAIDHNFAGSAFSAEGSFSTIDSTQPTVVTQDITVQLGVSGNVTITPVQIDNGSSDNCGIQSISLDTISFDCMHVGTNTVILTVIDTNGNSASGTATITVEDKVVPTVVTQDIIVQLDASGNVTITPAQIDNGSSDNCSIQSMSLDTTSFDCIQLGTNTVTLTITDVNGNSDTKTATVTVEDKVVPTVVTQDITVQLDASNNATITTAQIDNGSSDNCGIQSMSLDVTSFDCTNVGTNTVALMVTDVNGNSDTKTATVTVEDKIVPTVVTQDIIVQLDTSGNVTITPAQIDNGSTDNCGIQSMSLDVTSFDCIHVGTNTVILTVTDVNGNSASGTATISVEDKVVPTVVTQDITVQLDTSGNVTITPAQIDNGSTDNCGIQSMSLDITTFDCTHVGANTVNLTVTDVNGNTDTKTATITVEDKVLPTVVTQNITIQLDASNNATITTAQIDNGSSDACGIQSMSLDITSFDCTHIGDNTVTLTVIDTSGNSNTGTAVVTVQDVIAPIANCIAPFVLQLDASGSVTLTASDIDNKSIDNCGTISRSVDKQLFTLGDLGEQNITLTITDQSGNTTSCTTTVTIIDVTPPVITIIGDNPLTVFLGDDYIEMGAETDDGSPVMIDTSDYKNELGEYVIRYSATDLSGNSTEITRTVLVKRKDEFIFEVYPNPITTYMTVIGSKDMHFLEIYDMTGQRIQSYTKEFIGKPIAMDQYPSGIYWLRADFDSTPSEYIKIMIKSR